MNNRLKFLVFMYLFLFFSCSRKNVGTAILKQKDMNESIPVSNLNMGRTLNISFGGDYRVIFSDATCIVLGEKGVMSVLFAKPNFYPSNIPENLKPRFYDIEMINLVVAIHITVNSLSSRIG